jgi:hypothetical protein
MTSIEIANITGCGPTDLTGYFLVKIDGLTSYNLITEVIAGLVTDFPSC